QETDPPAEQELLRTSGPARFDRRTLLQAAIGLAIAGAYRAAPAADAPVSALLQRLAEDELRRSPEEATGSQFDIGSNASLRSQLDDRSLESVAKRRKAVDAALAQLKRINRGSLGPAAQLDYDV